MKASGSVAAEQPTWIEIARSEIGSRRAVVASALGTASRGSRGSTRSGHSIRNGGRYGDGRRCRQAAGFVARMNALRNLPSVSSATADASSPFASRNSRASSAV